MIKELFAAMNDALEEVIREHPTAVGVQKQVLAEQLEVLKAMSEAIIEEWLLFEEKMSTISPVPAIQGKTGNSFPLEHDEQMSKGQGYFRLLMYKEAIREFQQVVARYPDSMNARLYLALSYLQQTEYTEAYRHFKFLLPLTEDAKIKAVSYNAMGCIQAIQNNLEKACELFQLAYESDPTLKDPLINLAVCMEKEGMLQASDEITKKHFGY